MSSRASARFDQLRCQLRFIGHRSNYVPNPEGAERKHRGQVNCHFKVMFHVWRGEWLDGSRVQEDNAAMGCVLCGRVQG